MKNWQPFVSFPELAETKVQKSDLSKITKKFLVLTHRKNAGGVVSFYEIFVFELSAIDWGQPSTVRVYKITSLDHEIFDNSVKSTALKIALYFQKGCKKKDLDCEKCYPRSYLEKTMFNFDWNKNRVL